MNPQVRHRATGFEAVHVKFNELLANCVMYSTACDITDAANDIAAEGEPVDPADLTAVSPYITQHRSAGSGTGPST